MEIEKTDRHKNMAKHSFWVNKEIAEKLDKKIAEKNYRSRSEWYFEQIRNFLEK